MKFDVKDLAVNVMSAMLVDLAADPTFTIPDRQYVAAGPDIPFDCQELVVHATEVRATSAFGDAGFMEKTGFDVVFTVSLMVTIVRCVPVPQTETDLIAASVLDDSGREILNDGGALLRAAMAARERGALLPNCSNVTIGPIAWGTPDGMLVGTTLNLTAQL